MVFFSYLSRKNTNEEFFYVFVLTLTLSIFVFINLGKANLSANFIFNNSFIKYLYLKFSSNKVLQIISLFIFLILTQNDILNFETIDSDINSYLVTSKDILRGNLPYENQWESKTPMLYVFYAIFILLSGESLVYFKLLNDFLLFLVVLLMFKITKIKYQNGNVQPFITACLYISFMSFDWAKAEYSEIYVVFFLGLSYLYILNINNKYSVFKAGIFFSIATLVNQGSLIFFIPLIYSINKRFRPFFPNSFKFIIGTIIPHFITLCIYYFNGLFDIYYVTLFKIPLTYTQTNFVFIEQMVVYIRSIYEHNYILFFIFFSISIFFIGTILKLIFNKNFQNTFINFDNEINLFILFSVLFYYMAAKGYYHHTLFVIFFSTFLINQFSSKNFLIFFNVAVLVCSLSILFTTINPSSNNLKNLNNVENNYPLKQLAYLIDDYFDEEYTVLAFDYNLILYYLDKSNYSYIVHPQNHYEEFVTNELIKLDLIKPNEITELIADEPDVILCSGTQIINGKVTQINEFNCEVSDYNRKYKKLKTDQFRYSKNINFYPDPYREVGVYLKIND